MTLYSLVVGDIPLHDDNILALYHKIKTQPVEFNDDHKLALSPEIRDLITKMLIKDPNERITLAEIKVPLTQLFDKKCCYIKLHQYLSRIHMYAYFLLFQKHDWVTGCGLYPLPEEEENCRHLVEVTEFEVDNSVHSVPKLDTLILVKAMIKNRSFSNPFSLAAKERFSKSGRSNSAPEAYDIFEK